jgi:hypothetical protein
MKRFSVERFGVRVLVLILGGLLLSPVVFAETDSEAGIKILQYNSKRGRFKIQGEDGRRKWMSVVDLSQNDRNDVFEWLEANGELSQEEPLVVTIDPQVRPLTEKVELLGAATRKKRKCSYILSLENNADVSLEDLRVEYRYFIREIHFATGLGESIGGMAAYTRSPPQLGGTLVVDDIEQGQNLAFNIGAVELSGEYKKESVSSLFGSSYEDVPLREEQVIGVWVKLNGCKSDGTLFAQDICVPSDLKHEVSWGEEVPLLTPVSVTTSDPEGFML